MNVIKQHIDNIQCRFAYLKTRVEIAATLNLTDIHKYAEDFYKGLFNKLKNSFRNDNLDNSNSEYIDLVDDKNKTAIQITV